jgi:hypothetical protein
MKYFLFLIKKIFATGTNCIQKYGASMASTVVQLFAGLGQALTGGIIG